MTRDFGYRHFLRFGLALGCAVVMLGLLACSSTQKIVTPEDDFSRVSAVSVVRPGFAVKSGDTIAWRTEILWVGEDANGVYRRALTNLDIKGEIERQLKQDGLAFTEPAKADYVLVAVVMIGEAAQGSGVTELARLYPALGAVSQTMEKGTLMLGLSHPGSPVVLWRGAIQTYLAGDIPSAERKARLQSVVRSLLKTLPSRP